MCLLDKIKAPTTPLLHAFSCILYSREANSVQRAAVFCIRFGLSAFVCIGIRVKRTACSA